jgi:hypothetical protein
LFGVKKEIRADIVVEEWQGASAILLKVEYQLHEEI